MADDEQVLKRPRIEEDSATRKGICAQDVIRIHFQDPFFAAAFVHRPAFTHQLFDDEVILIENNVFDENSRVAILVDAQSLQFVVRIQTNKPVVDFDSWQDALREYFSQHLELGIPMGTSIEFVEAMPACMEAKEPRPAMIGSPIHSFSSQSKTGEHAHYQITLATHGDAGACETLSRLEKLAIWYIETASSVDFCDERWEVLFLYQVDPLHHHRSPEDGIISPKAVIAGYLTLYTFHNPILGSRIRVCQAFILPQRQKQGLGRELLSAAYRLAHTRSHVSEITVEDPCPGFQALRDQVDFELFCIQFLSSNAQQQQQQQHSLTEVTVAKELKITKDQAIFLCEAHQFISFLTIEPPVALPVSISFRHLSKNPQQMEALLDYLDDSKSFKSFRLAVKRQFVHRDQELAAMAKEDRQQELEELFSERLRRYLAVLPLAVKLGVLQDG